MNDAQPAWRSRSHPESRPRSRSPARHRRQHSRERRYDDRDDRGKYELKRLGPLPSQATSFAVTLGQADTEQPAKEKPNYFPTGLLAAASNTVTKADGTTVTLKYHEPAEARKPSPREQWRLYIFKDEDVLDTVDLGARSCWLIGREAAVADLEAAHPSVSKQHAVIQFRHVEKTDEYGDRTSAVKPYLIDLESAHGTRLNDRRVPESRYLELRNRDVIRFGNSSREYVLMRATG